MAAITPAIIAEEHAWNSLSLIEQAVYRTCTLSASDNVTDVRK